MTVFRDLSIVTNNAKLVRFALCLPLRWILVTQTRVGNDYSTYYRIELTPHRD